MARKSLVNDMTQGSIVRNLVLFSLPLMATNTLQTLYNMVDMIIIGRFGGSVGLSAVTIGGDVLMTLTFVAMGLCNAGQIIISQYVGAKDHYHVSRTIGTMFTLVLSGAVIISIITSFFVDPLLRLVNVPEESFAYARQYVYTCVVGLIFIYGYNLVSSILRGLGDSKHPLMFVAIAAVTNLVLDILFVAVFDMAVFGTALATIIGQAVSFFCSLIFLSKHKEDFMFDFKLRNFIPDRDVWPLLVKLGIPMILQSAAISFSMLFVGAYINSYGVVSVAVTGVGNKLGNIAGVVSMAISNACGTVIGQCIGADKQERVPKTIGVAFTICMIFSLILCVIMYFFPTAVFGLFDKDPEVLEMCLIYVPVAIINFIGFALRGPFFGLINGVGAPTLNLAVGLFDGVVCRIGLTMLLGVALGFGIQGFWYGYCFAGYAPFLIGFIFFVSGKWKTMKFVKTDKKQID